jgi:hypothetical protein
MFAVKCEVTLTLSPDNPNPSTPPPWSIDELEACFVVRDHRGSPMSISRMSPAGEF